MKSKHMHGFLCRPSESSIAAVCVPSSTRSVVVPRRPDRTLVDHAVLAAGFDSYTRLLESRRRSLASDATDAFGGEKKKKIAMDYSIKRETSVISGTKTTRSPLSALPVAPASLSSIATSSDAFQGWQVVVMRVSIHCQGCAGKVKKHIAKMEGVKSFNIDLEAKRVTVTGNISPVGVLESISKVKKAEFWHI